MSTRTKTRRGRRPSSEIEAERENHVNAAVLLHVKRLAAEVGAFVMGVSRSTFYAWAALGVTYPEYVAARDRARGLKARRPRRFAISA
jgi:hypothetical protein